MSYRISRSPWRSLERDSGTALNMGQIDEDRGHYCGCADGLGRRGSHGAIGGGMAGCGRPACTGTVAGTGLRRPPEGDRRQDFDPERPDRVWWREGRGRRGHRRLDRRARPGRKSGRAAKNDRQSRKGGRRFARGLRRRNQGGEGLGRPGLVDEAVKAAVGPVVDALKAAAGALWGRHVKMEDLEIDTIKGQLEAAKWPDFGP